MDYENQKMLETFFNERQTSKLLHKELTDCEMVVTLVNQSELDREFAYDLMRQMILCKRAHVTQLVGQLRHHFKAAIDPFQACADALVQAASNNLVDLDPDKAVFSVAFDIDQKTANLIAQYQYLPPMIVPPLELDPEKGNRGSGYLTIDKDSLLLKDNHHEGDIGLDSLNRFNQVAFSINEDVVKGIRNNWKNLDRPKPDETFEEYKARTAAFERYEQDAFFTLALLIEMGNRFWFTHKSDKRGRTYSQGYHAQYQGNDWNKACLELADKELVT